jgi:hypothetical protein
MHILKSYFEIGIGYFIRWSTASSLQRRQFLNSQSTGKATPECKTATTLCKEKQMA